MLLYITDPPLLLHITLRYTSTNSSAHYSAVHTHHLFYTLPNITLTLYSTLNCTPISSSVRHCTLHCITPHCPQNTRDSVMLLMANIFVAKYLFAFPRTKAKQITQYKITYVDGHACPPVRPQVSNRNL